jgi:6,7-dimethyl-8-ribityllumazine synthase
VTVLEGGVRGDGLRIAVVVCRWNELITKALLDGAVGALHRHGVAPADVDVVWVPGAFELPLAHQRLAATGRYHALVALGAVIRGATGHYELVAGQSAAGLQRVTVATGVPIGFGVLATETIEQAIERAGTKAGNKGAEAALTALEVATLLAAIDDAPPPA